MVTSLLKFILIKLGGVITDPATNGEASYRDVILFGLYSVSFAVTEFLQKNTITRVCTGVLANAFSGNYSDFIKSRYSEWREYLKGDIYSIILRIANCLPGIVKLISFKLIHNLSYVIILSYEFSHAVSYQINSIIFLMIIVYVVVVVLLYYIRGHMQARLNYYFDQSKSYSIDMLSNYELYQSYNAVETEMTGYLESENAYLFYYRLYWHFYHLIYIAEVLIQLLIQVFLLVKLLDTQMEAKDLFAICRLYDLLVENVIQVVSRIRSGLSNANNVMDNALYSLTPAIEGQLAKQDFTEKLTIENLCFTRSSGFSLKDVNVEIKKGLKVAIVGDNGAGKSTLLKLILQLEDHTGTIQIDGIDIKDLNNESRARLMAYIPQESHMFQGTILDNLRLHNESVDEEKVMALCKLYGVHSILKNPGYDFMVEEHGANLSFLQKQSISMMRAVIQGSPIILVDELTSSMNVDIEKQVLRALIDHGSDKTIIMIIHNKDLLHHFDKVLHFERGKVVMKD